MEHPKTRIDLSELTALAANGLVQMFDPAANIFCARLLRTPEGLVQYGHSPRYTVMTLLGLREREKSGLRTQFETQEIYRNFVRNTEWINGAGDLGLLLWLVAEFDQESLPTFFAKFDLGCALKRYEDGRKCSTTELSWFLAGLSHAERTSKTVAGRLSKTAEQTYQLIQANQGQSGFFGHLATRRSVRGLLRGQIGSFADQIYPIYALAEYAMAFQRREVLAPALKCARAICGAQGRLGQWWWLYHSESGRILSRYPVYSVHQHAMAPMGLFALEKATGESFQEQIYKGLSWIYGQNELEVDMRDFEKNVVWRCIRPQNKSAKYLDVISSVLRVPKMNGQARKLEVLYEDWPYELGWLLFAFSNNELWINSENDVARISEVK
jgi:hypothetical protein